VVGAYGLHMHGRINDCQPNLLCITMHYNHNTVDSVNILSDHLWGNPSYFDIT